MPGMPYLLHAPGRPVAFTVVLWAVVAFATVSLVVAGPHRIAAGGLGTVGVALAVANVAAVVVLWGLLPWDSSPRARALAPALVAATMFLGLTSVAYVQLALLVVGLAGVARAWGTGLAVGGVAALVVALGATQAALTPDEPLRTVGQMGALAFGGALALGLTGASAPTREPSSPPSLSSPPPTSPWPSPASPPPPPASPPSPPPPSSSPPPSPPSESRSPNDGASAVEPPTRSGSLGFPGEDLLTRREREVARLVGLGHTNGEISATLHLTEGTVKNHVSSALRKLGLRDRTQLALRVVRR
ncbi:helix-turn-helix transcriptional regulator [Myceligenerans salitolerans]|nr:response regulator transcription factor [Myceligenerans salitolerans]